MIRRSNNSFALSGGTQQIVNVGAGNASSGGSFVGGANGFYTIEEHLRSFEESPIYKNLINRWFVEKQEYKRQLATISATYAEYSLHDHTHSEKIILMIERLLGPERIAFLSPGDAWLILQCAYTHDLGMCVTESEKYAFLVSDDFIDKIKDPKNREVFDEILDVLIKREHHYSYTRSHDGVRLAADYWRKNKDKLYSSRQFAKAVLRDDFSLASYYLNTVIREYFRSRHAERSRDELIKRYQSTVERDGIPGHMREAVAQIVNRHCGHPDRIKDLKYRQDGFHSGDFIHPRFVASLLRMGDLMDMETTRFNPYLIDTLDYITKDNMAYMLKDLSVSEILVDDRTICVTSSFRRNHVRDFLSRHKPGIGGKTPDVDDVEKLISNAIKYMRDWMNYIKQNAEWIWAAWSDIAPKAFPGSIAAAKKLRILLDDRELDENDMGLKYVIDPSRAAQIIEGAELYDTRFVFLREIIQNAIDATKIQFFRHFKEAIKSKSNGVEISFVDFLRKFDVDFKNNAVEVSVDTNDELTEMEITVTDRGTGIIRKRLDAMKRIGSSNDPEYDKEIAPIPEWLRPTAEFGIGMQTVFLVSDRFTVLTNPWNKEKGGDDMQRRIVFNCTKLGGDITSLDSVVNKNGLECWEKEPGKKYPNGIRYPRGTRVIIKIGLDVCSDLVASMTDISEDESFFNRLSLTSAITRGCKELLEDTFVNEIIPITIKINDKTEGKVHDINFNTVPYADAIYDEDIPYIRFYEEGEERSIYFWYDNELHGRKRFCALFRFTADKKDDKPATRLFFRGIRFGESDKTLLKAVRLQGCSCDVNVLSGDANDWLEVNRDNIKKDKREMIRENLVTGLSDFVCGMTRLAGILNRKSISSGESQASLQLRETLKSSKSFAKMLWIHAIIDGADANDAAAKYIAGIVGLSVEIAIVDESGASIDCKEERISTAKQPGALFIDYAEFKVDSTFELDKEDVRIIKAQEDRPAVKMAIRRNLPTTGNKKFSKIDAYKMNIEDSTRIAKIYELHDNASFTKIDKPSYTVIVNHTIEEYINENSKKEYLVFPAPESSWFEGAGIITLKKQPPVSQKRYDSLCDSRFASFAFAPFPSEIMGNPDVLEKLRITGTGVKLVREYMEDAKWAQYYKQMIEFTKLHGDVPDGLNEKKAEDMIVSAWGEYAEFIAKL